MPTPTVENYIKQIYLQHRTDATRFLPMKQLADSMGVSPGTATAMVKGLADSDLITYEPRNGSRLTDTGVKLALRVLRRHRLVELFLVEILGLDWSEVHSEADRLEHATSDKVMAGIDRLLNYPEVDPHGDPIPSDRGDIDETRFSGLDGCASGADVTVARITDQDPRFLQFAERSFLTPGTPLAVVLVDPIADAITVQPSGQAQVTLGRSAARKILVKNA